MKRILQVFLAIIFTISIFSANVVGIEAKTLNDLYSELNKLETQKANSINAKKLTESEIQTKKNDIAVAKANIATKNIEIEAANSKILALKEDVVQKGIEIEDLLVYYQTNKQINEKISFIVEGESITEAIHRNNVFTQLTDASNDKILEFEQMQVDLTDQITQLKSDMVNLDNLTKELDKKVIELYGNLDTLSKEEFTVDESIGIIKSDITYYEQLGCGIDEDLQACINRNTPSAPSSSGFIRPIAEGYVTSEWGFRPMFGDFHTGIDLAIGGNPPIYAAAPGIVANSGYATYAGYYVAINHTVNGEHLSTVYAHMAFEPIVSKGQVVNTNTQLGNMGTTGASTGDHLHFQISYGWIFIDYNSLTQNTYNPRYSINFPDTGGYFNTR